jgi:hypothetical protein
MNLLEYCKQNKINLLPDDIKHIRKCISHLSANERRQVLRRYVIIWQQMLGECENAAQAENLGRRSANLFILGIKK